MTDNVTPIAKMIIFFMLILYAIPVAIYRTCMEWEEKFHKSGD